MLAELAISDVVSHRREGRCVCIEDSPYHHEPVRNASGPGTCSAARSCCTSAAISYWRFRLWALGELDLLLRLETRGLLSVCLGWTQLLRRSAQCSERQKDK